MRNTGVFAPLLSLFRRQCTPARGVALPCFLLLVLAGPPASGLQSTEPVLQAAVTQTAAPGAALAPLTPDQRILQVLDRFTYGPRPGDIEHVRAIGLSAWLKQQLNPVMIDDSALEERLARFPALRMPLDRMMEEFPDEGQVKAAIDGRSGPDFNSTSRAIYSNAEARYRDRKDKQSGKDEETARDRDLPIPAEQLLALPAPDRFKTLCRLSPEQLHTLRETLSPAERGQLTAGFTPVQLEALAAFGNPHAVIEAEDVQAKLLRDVYSERQLQEVMTDFWLNHFNVYMRKNQRAPYFIAVYDRDTVRPHALGRFVDLLMATAQSPAMLEYLDNALSVGPTSESVTHLQSGFEAARTAARQSGLNENYARELMELHTIGVNGGYTQADVTQVAKVFTGWTVEAPRYSSFPYRPTFDYTKHEFGDKLVLGHKIRTNGSEEGVAVLRLLAGTPECAHFISHKLAVRFVADEPPPALVERMAQTFLQTGGDIRRVLITMINSPEFFAPTNFRSKVKTPLDFVVSAVRAAGADVQSTAGLAQAVADLGMPVYGMQTPNGYSMQSEAWNSTNALVSRMNFAMALTTNRLAGVSTNLDGLLGTDAASVSAQTKDETLEQAILHVPVSERTQRLIVQQTSASASQQASELRQIGSIRGTHDPFAESRPKPGSNTPDPEASLAAGLIFGSPEFQRR